MSKEEHYEERKRLYNLFKTDCPQTIGETDKAFDNDNFIDWLVDNQNTKPLIEEIAELKAEVNNLTNANDEYFKVNKQLESELKASKSEANEADYTEEQVNELIETICFRLRSGHFKTLDLKISAINRIKNEDYKHWKTTLNKTRNNK